MPIRHHFNLALKKYYKCTNIRRMEKKPYPSETQERFIVRFPDGMRDRIAEAAKTNNRSMNAEIVARLQDSLAMTQPKPWDMPSADEIADKVMERMEKKTSSKGKLGSAQN